MVSVNPVSSFALARTKSTKKKQTQNPQVFYAENSAAAARFLDLLASNNKADRKSTRLNSSHTDSSRMPSSA